MKSMMHDGTSAAATSKMCSHECIEVKRKDFSNYANYLQAGHCMIFARLPGRCFEWNALRAAVLMQMRFDGHIGFPGGEIDEGEEVLLGVIRELEEEINFDSKSIKLTEDHHLVTYWLASKKLLLHFYVLEVSEEQLKAIEHRALDSHDYGQEVMGMFRVPLYTMGDGERGFPTFLRHSFIGIAYSQLRKGILHAKIMSKEEIKAAELASGCRV